MLTTTLFSTDSFFRQKDKQQHIQITTVISLMTSMVANEAGYTPTESFFIGLGAALLVGLVKEGIDSRKGGSGFSGKDMLADGIGGALGSTSMFVLYKWK